jgi:hypothetical protein
MHYRAILNKTLEKLRAMGHDAALVKKLGYAENMDELHSVLREYVLGTDAKVNAFLDQVKGELQGQASQVVGRMLDTPARKCPNCGYTL